MSKDASAPFLLLVEDHPLGAKTTARCLGRTISVQTVADAAGALAVIEADVSGLAGLVVDVSLRRVGKGDPPDRSGLTVLSRFRARYPELGALVLTGHGDEQVIRRTCRANALFLRKPADGRALRNFAARCLAQSHRRPSGGAKAPAFDGLTLAQGEARRAGLTPQQTRILALNLEGLDREACALTLGIAVNTYDNHVKAILDRTGADSMRTLTHRLLRDSARSVGQGPVKQVG